MDPRTEDTTTMTTNKLNDPAGAAWRASLGLPEAYEDLMAAAFLDAIDAQSRGPIGNTNPLATVTCPHCSGRMAAIDAKAHVRTMAR